MINAAIGMVMARGGCDADQAKRLLLERAEHRSETLLDSAEWELREGEFRRPGRDRDSETAPDET
jgi:hypothetical protein